MGIEASGYGRSGDEWDRMVEVAEAFLEGKASSRGFTTYTELSEALVDRDLPGFDFGSPAERAAMGHLLGLVVQANFPKSRCVLSALVHYLDGSDAGPGFYALAQDFGLLRRGASKADKDAFWIGQINALYDHYAGKVSR